MHYRHGDLLIVRVPAVPSDARPTDEKVLAHGEVTGHAHRVDTAQLLTVGDTVYVRVDERARLTHEEHRAIDLPAGLYRVVHQREYAPRHDHARDLSWSRVED